MQLIPPASYIRAYCALLLYWGSCPPSVYDAVIRPSMRLRHPSFSGTWAADYWPVKDLLRGRRMPFGEVRESPDVRNAVRLQQLVHGIIHHPARADGVAS